MASESAKGGFWVPRFCRLRHQIKQFRQFGLGVFGQHRAGFAEMEQAFPRPHQPFISTVASAR